MQLPTNLTPADFDSRYRLDAQTWLPVIAEICHDHGLSSTALAPFADGSNLIASVADEFVIKVFPPFHRNQWESEYRTLRELGKHDISIPIPRLVAHNERDDGWTYVILSKLPGVTLESIWPQIDLAEKAEIMGQIGRIMARVHQVPVGELQDLDPPWASFLPAQMSQCKTRHEHLVMPDWFLNEIDDYVTATVALIPNESSVILTGEYTPFNVLVSQKDARWKITGMIDFGDAMVGFREYDFLGPCLFLGEGNAALIDALFHGYGYGNPRSDAALRSRLLMLAALHRYSNLDAQIRIDGWRSRVRSLAELEGLIFGLEKTIA
jgi:hygromycin-B 7''-O-kinase